MQTLCSAWKCFWEPFVFSHQHLFAALVLVREATIWMQTRSKDRKHLTPHTLWQLLGPFRIFSLFIHILSICLQFNLFSTKWKVLMGVLSGKEARPGLFKYLPDKAQTAAYWLDWFFLNSSTSCLKLSESLWGERACVQKSSHVHNTVIAIICHFYCNSTHIFFGTSCILMCWWLLLCDIYCLAHMSYGYSQTGINNLQYTFRFHF